MPCRKEQFWWRSKEAREDFRVGPWKEILKENFWVSENRISMIGDVTRVRFWTDPWCGTSTLKFSFIALYELAVNKNEIVADVWDRSEMGLEI